jgi:tRNA (guanine-N7-)-methyltransferase
MSYSISRGKPMLTGGVGIDMSELPPHEEGRIDPRGWFGETRQQINTSTNQQEAITARSSPLDPSVPFSGHPFHIEIGSGKGTFLVQEARLRPDVDFLGIESAAAFYRYAADRVRRHGLANVRMLRGDAVEFLRFWCTDEVADVIHLYFSDPWPKKRHHKRRVVQDESLAEFHRVLKRDGELRLVTDHVELARWYEEHAERNARLFERCDFMPPASAQPGEVVGTNYERKFAVEGRAIHAMTLRKR